MHKLRIKYDINNSLNLDEVYNVDCLCYDIKKLLKMNQFVPALFLALLIPDICGQIIFNNNRGKRYCDWFNKYVKKEYRITKEEKEDILENLSSENKFGDFLEVHSNFIKKELLKGTVKPREEIEVEYSIASVKPTELN